MGRFEVEVVFTAGNGEVEEGAEDDTSEVHLLLVTL